MCRIASILFVVTFLVSCSQQPTPAFQSTSYALVGGTMVDSRGALDEEPGLLWILDNRIHYVGAVDGIELPDSVLQVDVSGKWVLPGLMDLHIHPPARSDQGSVMKTLLAFGITTVRVAASTVESGTALKEQSHSGAFVGPHVVTAGRLIDGPNSVHATAAEVISREEIRQEIAAQAEQGVDYIKLYTGLEKELVEEAVDISHDLGLKVLGHLGQTSWYDASSSGIDAITHSGFIGPIWELVPSELHPEFQTSHPGTSINELRLWLSYLNESDSGLDSLAINMLQHDVEVNPTLVLTWAMIYGSEPDSIERFEPHFAPPDQSRRWIGRPHPFSRAIGPYSTAFADSLYEAFAYIIAGLHNRGVRITTGTDLILPWMTPGVALHEEMVLLADAGLSNSDVLAAATINGAESIGLRSVGQLRDGWKADLIIIDANPLVDVSNLRQVEMVIKDGVAYYHDELLLNE
ncbi:MAG: amidohydrolase family protein [Rhodothermales bacterium]|nr:amidohydrolase family protein [Rhodothermales bacterium]